MRIEAKKDRKPELIWRPHPGPQTNFLKSSAFEVLYGGARGGGKSDALLYGLLRQVNHPRYRCLILRRTFPELRELIDRSHEFFPILGGKWIASEKRWEWPSGATYEFGYCQTYEEAQQYRGQQYTVIGYDEIGLIPDERVWLTLITSIRHTAEGLRKQILGTANPGGPGHGWVKRRFILPCPPDGTLITDEHGNSKAFFQARVYDNPSILEKDPLYVRQLEALPSVMRLQELEGDWDAGEGIAFPGLTDRSHLVQPGSHDHLGVRFFGGFDWGYGHRWAFVLCATLPDGNVRIVDAAGGRRQIPEEIAERVRDTLHAHGLQFSDLAYTVAGSDVKIRDEARGAFGPSVMEQFQQHGWSLMNADTSRIAGYQNLLAYLHQRAVLFQDTPGNRAGISLLLTLATDPDNPNDVLKQDVNPHTGEGGDDFYDALRYALMSRPIRKTITVTARMAKEQNLHRPRPLEPEHAPQWRTPPYQMPSRIGGTRTTDVV